MFCGIAGDRAGRADVGRRRQGDQVRDGVEPHPPCQVQHQRRQRQAHDVVDEKRRQHAGQRDGHGQQADGRADAPQRQAVIRWKKPDRRRKPIDDHHAEEQEQRLVVDGSVPTACFQRQHAGDQHESRPDQSDAGPVHAQTGHLAQRQTDVGQREHDRRSTRWSSRRSTSTPTASARPSIRSIAVASWAGFPA